MQNGEITFNIGKQFVYIRPLGSGGTGDTHLFLDETTNIYFAIKKYSPKDEQYRDEYYSRFVDEIKILFNLSHPNIVRVYTYFLYPEKKVGYLQMEFIEGKPINMYCPLDFANDKSWESIFTEAISAFGYLEHNGILHRDIRPENILIDINQNLKIIDFGFGKKLANDEKTADSIILNWPVSEHPEEVENLHTYNHQSEIYYLGKLFAYILQDKFKDFSYSYIIEKMIKKSCSERYTSFDEIEREISLGILTELDFSTDEKQIYLNFANALIGRINHYIDKYESVNDTTTTLNKIADILRKSALEEFLQDNSLLIDAFIKGRFNYNIGKTIKICWIKDFYKFIKSIDNRKQKIVMDNIYLRLSTINIQYELEVPF